MTPAQERAWKYNPAPSSSMSYGEALDFAQLWVKAKPNERRWFTVKPTGSMLPVLDQNCILLAEKVTAPCLLKNDMGIYVNKTKQLVVHFAKEIRPDGIWFDGINNHYGDGWIAPSCVQWRVAGVLYTQRDE